MRILYICFSVVISTFFVACSINNGGFTPKGHSIAVIDSGFDKNRLTSRVEIDSSLADDISYNSLKHGTDVATIILKYNSDAIIYGYSASSDPSGKYIYAQLEMFQRAYNNGARIFNNSYGSSYTSNGNSIPDSAYEYTIYNSHNLELARMAARDSIFVWSAGNERNKYASYTSHVPLVADKIGNIIEPETWRNAKRGWITVVSINDNGKFDDSYSNWVGEDAKNWGIAAFGTYRGDFMLGNTIQGTSFAAPRVSAAVANVWDKFPWMSNHLVTQTILSTADKYTIDESRNEYGGTDNDFFYSGVVTDGPNKKVGWGVLNEQRALKGPARFDTRLLVDSDNGQVQVNFDNANYALENITWSNDIAGDAGLNKSGSGVLYLTGKNTYTGKTTINEGNVIVSNAILNSNITIESKGSLTTQNLGGEKHDNIILGDGKFTLSNNGSFNVFDKTIINGNYEGVADSRVLFDITNSNLEVKGAMNMGNGEIVAYAGSIPQTKTVTKEIIKANGGIINWDDSYSSASAYINIEDINISNDALEVSYNRNSTQLLMKSQGYSTNHILDISNRVDEALDSVSLSNLDTKEYKEALGLINTNISLLPNAIKSLSGEIYDSSINILLKQNDMLNRAYARRIYGILMSENDGVYAEVLHGRSKISQDDFASGKITLNSVMAGYDKRFENISLGIAGYFGDSKGEFDIAGSSHLQSFGGSIYFGAKFDMFYILGRVGAGMANIKANRILAFGETAQIEGNGAYAMLNIYNEMGLRLGNDNFNIVPFVAVEWDKFWRDKINEKGSNFALDIAKQSNDTSSLLGGVKLELGSSFKVNGSFFHKKLLSKANISSNAIYSGIATNSFTLRGINQTDNLTFAGAGVKYDIDGFSMFVDYLVSFKDLFSKAALEDSMISAGFRIGF